MRISIAIHYASYLLMGVGLAMFLPLIFSLYYGESDQNAFAFSIIITLSCAIILFFATRSKTEDDATGPSRRESMALVTFSWIQASIFASLPYHFNGTFPCYTDALFEATSGFTTTGASAMTSIESQPHGILLWRSFTQWLGGMGIVVLFVAMFPLLGVGAAYLVDAEAPGSEVQRLHARVRNTSRTIWLLYVGFTALEVLLLLSMGGLPLFDALTHSFSTMAIGGFSTQDMSIGSYDSLSVNIIITGFMFMAGINFALYYNLLLGHSLKTFWNNMEFRLYALIMASATLLIAWDLIANADYSAGQAFEESMFTSTSIQTTTGFAISDFNAWPTFSVVILLTLMMIGGCAGSTAGAIKVIRVAIIAKYALREILLALNPRTIRPIRLGGHIISEKLVSRVMGFTLLYFLILAAATLVMASLGYDLKTSISSVVASVGNVGPGLGLVGPAANYAEISAAGKYVLMGCMLVGRLEILTVLALLTPAFWKWR